MAAEFTYAMIKPDAVLAKNAGKIIDMIEAHGFEIIKMEKREMSRADAEAFYAEHKERPFFGELVNYITSGPVVAMVLAKDGAVLAWRDLMGATDPAKAAEGTVRKLFGTNIGSNATHGSDSLVSAEREISLIFP